MFSEIVAVFNDLPESQRALYAAIDLARACNAELATVSILGRSFCLHLILPSLLLATSLRSFSECQLRLFFPEQPYLDRLRSGFSAVVTVHTGNAGGR
jgi:hypothetical protein